MDHAAVRPMQNRFRQALASGRSLIGIWCMLNSTAAVESLSKLDFDWLLIDGEHAPTSLQDTIGHLRAMSESSTASVVRLPWNDPVLIKRFLDAGAETLM